MSVKKRILFKQALSIFKNLFCDTFIFHLLTLRFRSLAVSGRDRRGEGLLLDNLIFKVLNSVVWSHNWQLVWLELVVYVERLVGVLLEH
jgi:hypothetical protein